MRKLVDGTNVNAVDAEHLKGSVRDKDGATPGTIYSEDIHGDIFEFFHKLVSLSGIVENNLEDNETNEHQLIEAVKTALYDDTDWALITSLPGGSLENGAVDGVDAPGGFGKLRCKRLSDIVYVVGSHTGGDFILPVGFRPSGLTGFSFIAKASGNIGIKQVEPSGKVFSAGGGGLVSILLIFTFR